jgi:NAD-dependent deacetylase
LVELSRYRDVSLATQNIDGLHQRAGSTGVQELHGTLWRLRCTACRFKEENTASPLQSLPPQCPHCGSLLRPDIVLYTESLPEKVLSAAVRSSECCDLMLVVGTSGVVYPAAGIPKVARAHGAVVVEINPYATPLSQEMDYSLRAPAAQALPRLLE